MFGFCWICLISQYFGAKFLSLFQRWLVSSRGTSLGLIDQSAHPSSIDLLSFSSSWLLGCQNDRAKWLGFQRAKNCYCSCYTAPCRLFSPIDISKKLSHHFLLHFWIDIGSYDHHAKYQGVFQDLLENTFFIRDPPLDKENLNEFKGGTLMKQVFYRRSWNTPWYFVWWS